MKNLYELSQICSPQRSVVEAIVRATENSSILALYGILFSGQNLTNADAMLQVFGRRDVKQFSTLKSKMFDILIKVISIQNVSSDNDNIRYNKVLSSLRRNIAARVILYKGSRSLAIELLESALTTSLNDQITYDVLDQLRILKVHYGTSIFNKYKLKRCYELEGNYLNLLENESKAIDYYINLKKIELQSLAQISTKDRELADIYVKELSLIDGKTRNFKHYRFQVYVKKLEFDRDFEALIKLCDQSEIEFNSLEFYSLSSIVAVKQVRLWSLIQLARYSECLPIATPELANDNLGATNWYSFLHYSMKALLYDFKRFC